MKIKEIENKNLQIQKVNMECDKRIKDKQGKSIAPPLMNTSHFMLISGASGSGKTNLLVNLLKSNKDTKDGKYKLSYRNMFNKVIFVSPSAATIKKSPLAKIADNQKFEELNYEVFDLLEEIGEDAVEEDKHNLLILDDVSSQLRSKENEKILNQTIKNRRHKNLSVWIITHKVTDAAPSLRSNANMIVLFRPKTNKEKTAIQEEYMLLPKKEAEEIFDAAFKTRFDFLLIDASLREGPDFKFYRNFNELQFEMEE